MSEFNCSVFTNYKSLEQYMSLLEDETDFDPELLGACKIEICSAIWGIGNPDIAGIGMMAGYILEFVLGFVLATITFVLRSNDIADEWLREIFFKAVDGAFVSFFDAAIHFALAIQIASIVLLAQRDFSDTTAGLGAVDTQVSWAVSVICLVPLLYPLFFLQGEPRNDVLDKAKEEKLLKGRGRYRYWLYCLAVCLSFYPFLTQCVHGFAPSTREEAVSDSDFNTIVEVCYSQDNQRLSGREEDVLKWFETLGWVAVFFPALGGLWALTPKSWRHGLIQSKYNSGRARWLLLVIPWVLEVPLLWGLFRLRSVNKGLAGSIEAVYEDDEWGFGQIVSLVIFAPVIFEFGYTYWESWVVQDAVHQSNIAGQA
ncbi:hypothetical protein MKZ38_010387 [Zalerion maritima]|uniref:Uncharacterized protein n=1 Tax=Zalerion maritima TaxID=339359 RepID=A0AAD5RSC6_9PEZI|nr:hypothetical protein MKZ38_010387 [Zalerion maritima]